MLLAISVIVGILILLAMILSALCRNSKATYIFLCLINIYIIISILDIVCLLLDFYVEVQQNRVAGIGVLVIVLWVMPFYLFIVLYRVLTAAIARWAESSQPVTPSKFLYWLSNVAAYSLVLPLIALALGVIILPFI